MKSTIISLLFIATFVLSCKKDEVKCDGSTPTYATDIKPILDNNCMGCHDAGGSNTDYSTYSKLTPVLNNGKFESEVITRQSMPRGSSLTASQLSKIKCWIENGFPQ